MLGYFTIAIFFVVILFSGLVGLRYNGIIDISLLWLIIPFTVFLVVLSILFVAHYLFTPQSPSRGTDDDTHLFTPKATFWAPAWYHKWHPFNLFTDTPITLSHNNNRPELRVTPHTVSLDVFLGKNEIPVTDIAVVRVRTGTHFLYVDIFTTNETYYGASFVQQQNEDIITPVIEAFTSIGIEVLPE